MIYLLQGNRVYRSYYGGKNLDAFFGVEVPSVTQFPEEWIASLTRAYNPGREKIIEGYSYCREGETLKEIIDKDPISMLGDENYKKYGSKMPFLVKLLDSAERLFIQCHPTNEFAQKNFNSQFGKTECWYIISADEDACVYLGFKPGATKQKLVDYFMCQDVEGMLNMMHKIPVKAGDVIFVDGGVPHAIGAGCFIVELQEPTDYMVIPERTSPSGISLPDKKMHGGLGFDKMFEVFDFTHYTYEALCEKFVKNIKLKKNVFNTVVGEEWTDKFKLSCIDLDGEISFETSGKCCVSLVLEGECFVKNSQQFLHLKKGDELFIAANTSPSIINGKAKIILCQ